MNRIIKALMMVLFFASSCGHGFKNTTGNNHDTIPVKRYDSMIYVQGGSFLMGDDSSRDEAPTHTIVLKSFYIGEYDITVGEFREFIDATGYETDAEIMGYSNLDRGIHNAQIEGVNWECDDRGSKRPRSQDSYPVVYVSWNDAMAYCLWLSGKTGRKYRLPTEGEWEYAARGGVHDTDNYTYSGSNNIDEVAWYEANSDTTIHAVGLKKPNQLGIYDMTGNVQQWCYNWYTEYYRDNSGIESKGRYQTTLKNIRGLSWNYAERFCKLTYRVRWTPYSHKNDLGFRVVYTL